MFILDYSDRLTIIFPYNFTSYQYSYSLQTILGETIEYQQRV